MAQDVLNDLSMFAVVSIATFAALISGGIYFAFVPAQFRQRDNIITYGECLRYGAVSVIAFFVWTLLCATPLFLIGEPAATNFFLAIWVAGVSLIGMLFLSVAFADPDSKRHLIAQFGSEDAIPTFDVVLAVLKHTPMFLGLNVGISILIVQTSNEEALDVMSLIAGFALAGTLMFSLQLYLTSVAQRAVGSNWRLSARASSSVVAQGWNRLRTDAEYRGELLTTLSFAVGLAVYFGAGPLLFSWGWISEAQRNNLPTVFGLGVLVLAASAVLLEGLLRKHGSRRMAFFRALSLLSYAPSVYSLGIVSKWIFYDDAFQTFVGTLTVIGMICGSSLATSILMAIVWRFARTRDSATA